MILLLLPRLTELSFVLFFELIIFAAAEEDVEAVESKLLLVFPKKFDLAAEGVEIGDDSFPIVPNERLSKAFEVEGVRADFGSGEGGELASSMDMLGMADEELGR